MHQLLWNTSHINTGSTQAPDRPFENKTWNSIQATLILIKNFCFLTDKMLLQVRTTMSGKSGWQTSPQKVVNNPPVNITNNVVWWRPFFYSNISNRQCWSWVKGKTNKSFRKKSKYYRMPTILLLIAVDNNSKPKFWLYLEVMGKRNPIQQLFSHILQL